MPVTLTKEVCFLSLLTTFSTLFPMSFSTLFYPFSPRLDDIGNSVRGVEFCKLIAKRFSFHAFAPLTEDTGSNKEVEEGEKTFQDDGANVENE